MSSPGSGALRVEIPSRSVAERVTVGLLLASGSAIEVVAALYPDGPIGLGLAVGLLLAAWHWHRRRKAPSPTFATLDRQGAWQLGLADGRVVAAVLRPGSRILGRTLVLRWRAGKLVRSAWLTAWDVPPAQLRELTVRLLAAGAQVGA